MDCPDPDHMTSHERRVARIAHEEASFDAEYYLYVTLYLALYLGHIMETKVYFPPPCDLRTRLPCAWLGSCVRSYIMTGK